MESKLQGEEKVCEEEFLRSFQLELRAEFEEEGFHPRDGDAARLKAKQVLHIFDSRFVNGVAMILVEKKSYSPFRRQPSTRKRKTHPRSAKAICMCRYVSCLHSYTSSAAEEWGKISSNKKRLRLIIAQS